MEWKGPKMMVSIRLPEDLHRAVRGAAATKGLTAEAAYIEALTTWLGLAKEPDETDPRLSKLQTILDSGDELAIDAVTHGVDFFHERLRPQRPKRRA